MIIYRIIKSYEEFEQGTEFVFNKTKQRFETLNHRQFISNGESAKNPGLITIYMETPDKPKRQERVWHIGF